MVSWVSRYEPQERVNSWAPVDKQREIRRKGLGQDIPQGTTPPSTPSLSPPTSPHLPQVYPPSQIVYSNFKSING